MHFLKEKGGGFINPENMFVLLLIIFIQVALSYSTTF